MTKKKQNKLYFITWNQNIHTSSTSKIYILDIGHCLTEKGIHTKENLKIIKNNQLFHQRNSFKMAYFHPQNLNQIVKS